MPPRWSGEEDWVLRRLYRQGTPLRAIAEQVGRSPDAVAERRRTLGIAARSRSRPWSVLEDELLRAGSTIGLPASEIAIRLRRPPDQVRRRRHALVGARPPTVAFTPAEDEAIVACWARAGDIDTLAGQLDRPAGSERLRAQTLGLHRPLPRHRWRPYEDATVRDGYERGLTYTQIAAELTNRTTSAVAARAAKLGLATYARAWTTREDHQLRKLSETGIELERAAQMLARTPEALRARARKLHLPIPKSSRTGQPRRRWTPGEDDLLALHHALNPAALADLLGRSPEAITRRLRHLGLRPGYRSPHHLPPVRTGLTPGQRATAIRELHNATPARQFALARRLELPPAAIRQLAHDHKHHPAAGG